MKRSARFVELLLPFSCGFAACVWYMSHAQQVVNATQIKECRQVPSYRKLVSINSTVGLVSYCLPLAALHPESGLPD